MWTGADKGVDGRSEGELDGVDGWVWTGVDGGETGCGRVWTRVWMEDEGEVWTVVPMEDGGEREWVWTDGDGCGRGLDGRR